MIFRPRQSKPANATPGAVAALLATALSHHQSGNLNEARELYQQILATNPRHFDATHLLGVIALQSGNYDEAHRLIGEAVKIDPKAAPAIGNLGTVYLRTGRFDEARACFERALKIQPRDGNALLNLGTALYRLGRLPESATQLRRALAADAESVSARQILGAVLLEQGDLPGAIQAFEWVVKAQPDNFEAWNNLGTTYARAGTPDRALECYDRVRVLRPGFAPALGNRGLALAALGRADEAREAFELAVASDPGSASAHANFGKFLKDQGEFDAAVESLREAIARQPVLLDAQINLIATLRDTGRIDEAYERCVELVVNNPASAKVRVVLASLQLMRGELDSVVATLQEGVTMHDADAECHRRLGDVLMSLGAADDAVQAFERAVGIDPSDVEARWALAMATLRPVYRTITEMESSRLQFARAIGELDAWFDPARSARGHAAVGSAQAFYLAYQAEDNRELVSSYGRLCARLLAAWKTRPAGIRADRASQSPVRLGIASAHVREHSVWNAITKGWVDNFDSRLFELHVFHLGSHHDDETERVRNSVAHFLEAQHGLKAWVAAIESSDLDVLIYPEIGMDALTMRLAALRLAPVQATTWGHPHTSGLPTIDMFLSAEHLEPEAAQEHYSERLVMLPGLGVCYEPLTVTPIAVDLAELGLPQHVPLLLCPGTPFKYLPSHDHIWVDIARRLERGRLVFFQDRRAPMHVAFFDRLRRAFAVENVDFDARVCFVETLDRPRFFGLMGQAALMLDTIGFSGFNTALQGIEAGLPVVAREGDFMRGRLASGLLRRMGMDELVATTDQAFIDLAIELAHDESRRQSLRREIAERRPVLFNDIEPVRALERILEAAAHNTRSLQRPMNDNRAAPK